MSSQFSSPPRPREVPIAPGTHSGLIHPSAVILNQIRSIGRARLQKRLGSIDAATVRRVDEAIRIRLGLIDL